LATECGQVDVLSFQLVTMGQPMADFANELFAADSYRGYRGARFPFGYGACPNFEDRAKMMERLEPGRIGVDLSEGLQLHPEQSTDAFLLHHPEAKHFDV
jgi:5-methyltetrahydrofolate--homocysteine methyltransferase